MAKRCLVALILGIVLVPPIEAAKWQGGCPLVKTGPCWEDRSSRCVVLHRVGKGYTKVPLFEAQQKLQLKGPTPWTTVRGFNHVGHELTVRLKQREVDKPTLVGGFSTEPDGNSVVLAFQPVGSLKTEFIVLPPVPFTATSPTSATFTIPDSRPLIGRLLVGPASIIVFRGQTILFEIPKTVILPPMNDMRAIAEDGYEADILGALDRLGNVWFPLGFSGFGGGGESLPECPTELTPVTAFAVDLSLKKDEDEALPYVSMGQLKDNRLFLGDYVVFGQNFYGHKLGSLDMQPLAGNGAVLCALNDALQLLVKFPLQNPALGKGSVLIPLVRDGSPVKAKIHNISTDDYVASVLDRVDTDAFGSTCSQAP